MKKNKTHRFPWWCWTIEFALYVIFTILCVLCGSSDNLRNYGGFIIPIVIVVAIIVVVIFKTSKRLRTWYDFRIDSPKIDIWDIQEEVLLDIKQYPNKILVSNMLGLMGMLVIPTAILTGIGILHYNRVILVSINPWVLALAALIYLIYCIYVTRGMFSKQHVRINLGESTIYPLANGTRKILRAIDELETTSNKLRQDAEEVKKLQLPQPNISSKEVSETAPLIDYVKTVSDIGKSHPELSSLEQFILNITKFHSIDGWLSSFNDTVKSTGTLISSEGELVKGIAKGLRDYISHPDKETTNTLLENTLKHFSESGHGTAFRYRLMHSEGISGKIGSLGKELGKDLGKGASDTFTNADNLQNVHDSIDNLQGSLSDLLHHFEPSIDVDASDIFTPEFDFTGHFPLISTVKEIFVNIGRASDEDIDLSTSIEHSFNKIVGRGGGATLGSIIGSVLLPGVGTVVGTLVGSWLGDWVAKDINAQKFNELKEQLEKENTKLKELYNEVETNIKKKQYELVENLKAIADKEQVKLAEVKSESPVSKFDLNILLYAFNIITIDFLWNYAEYYSIESNHYNENIYYRVISLIPSSKDIHEHPQVTLKNMWNGLYALDRDGIEYDKYQRLSDCIQIMCKMTTESIATLQIANVLWLNKVRLNYSNCINNILNNSETQFKILQDFVSEKKNLIKNQVAICEDIAKQANNEAKTQ